MDSASSLARLVREAPEDAVRFTKERIARSGGQDFDRCFAEEHDRAFRELLLSPRPWT
jgi:hypothetical protein